MKLTEQQIAALRDSTRLDTESGQNRITIDPAIITALCNRILGCQCPECLKLPHWSSCAVHSEPAYPRGPCDCGALEGKGPNDELQSTRNGPDA